MLLYWEVEITSAVRMARSRALAWLLAAFCCVLVPTAAAQRVIYEIDSSESFIRFLPGVPNNNVDEGFEVMEGTRIVRTIAILEQAPGSLEASLGGTLEVAVSGQTITFAGGSVIDALESPVGPFLPGSHVGENGTGSLAEEDN